jgi:DNA polymerase-3 subunit alpha
MFERIPLVVASASSSQRDRAQGQVSLFDTMDFASAAPNPTQESHNLDIVEWSKDERLATEKELLGFYTSGHPLDKFRTVIDSDRFKKLGMLEQIDLSDARARHPFAGMIRHVEHKVTRTGKPFGVLHLEDFTGNAEVVCWGESYTPANDAGFLEPGKAIRLQASIQMDSHTESFRLTGSQIKELKIKAPPKNGPVQVNLWVARHSEKDLIAIREILKKFPGKFPVELHMQSGTGRRATITCSEELNVKKCVALEKALAPWTE